MRNLFLFLILFVASVAGFAQGTVRGFVYDKESGEPLIFVNVFLKGTSLGAATDVNGYYSITRIPEGTYELTISALGYDTIGETITITGKEIIAKNLTVGKATVGLSEHVVSAERMEARNDVQVSVQKITPKEITQIPSVGGEPDLAQYLQVIPGVIFTGDQGGQLYIRGGSPIQNKVLLDGMIVYNPFHSIGLFSVFDTDIIRNADIHTGGFNAEFGGRVSSIMDITTRDGNKNRISGKVSATTFGAKALIEGPIKKKSKTGGSTSFILSAKHSYLPQSSKLFYNYIDTAGLPFGYTDLYGKVSMTSGNGSKLNLFGFNFDDKVRYQAISDLHWNSFGGGTNFVLVPGGSPMLVEGNFAYSQYRINLTEGARPPRSSEIGGFNMGLNFTYFQGDNELKYGMEMLGFRTDFEFFNVLNRRISQSENTTEIAVFTKYKINTGKMIIEPGFRIHYYASLANISPEPRIGMKYNITDKLRIKLAGGLYSQNLISANSDRDVVNLFYGFLSGSSNLPDEFQEKDGDIRDVTHYLQKSIHGIAGVEIDLSRYITLNIEGYEKKFTQLSNLNRNKYFEDTPDNSDKPDQLKKDFIIETGDAYGVDLSVKYEKKRAYLWAAYSLAKVTRWDGIMEYLPIFDRRHNVNIVGAYTFGKGLNWSANVRWNLGSGFPFTPTQGFFPQVNFSEVNTEYTTVNETLGIQYGALNSKRLPYYHRLDMTLKRKIEINSRSTLEATLSVTNVYNRENIFYFDRVKYQRVDQLPLMPSAGVSLTF